MLGINKVLLAGNVGSDPEKRKAGNSTVTSFSLATSKKYKEKQLTEWHNIVIWGKLGDVAMKYVNKGDPVFIEGEITTNKWEDKDGNKKSSTEIVVTAIQFLKSKD